MTEEWPTDAQIPALLQEIEVQENAIKAMEITKVGILAKRWVDCGIPLGTGILTAFVLFVSADFLVALLDTARHTGYVAEIYHRNQEGSS